MNNDYQRPDPDALLRTIQSAEHESAPSAVLKIFFGMAAGAGKTYAMLEAARRLMREGADVVIGYIETHGRIETEQLVDGLELIPRKTVDYQGMHIEEFDIDAVLARKPALALVDELAHTNATGSRHPKRYQDVLELLDNGISVYTTLNVQHLESQADVVEKITGIKVRETIPDSVLDRAGEIELIDIPPDELLKRLAEGKVYVPEKAALAAERFFKKEHISALREMALHYTARLVGSELRDYNQQRNIRGPWKSGERLLVAISPSPYSEYLIRWTRRIAFNVNAPWVALYIEKQKPLSEAAQRLLAKNQNLARELGAEVVSTVDEDIVRGLLRIARQKNITQIVVGKPLRRYWTDLFSGGNLVARLLRSSGDIEIHVVTQPAVNIKQPGWFGAGARSLPGKDYGIAVACVSVITVAALLITPWTGYWAIALLYLLGIVLLSLFVGRGAVLVAAGQSALLWNFLFIPPLYTFRINRLEDALMFGMYFVVAMILGSLTSRLRLQERALRTREMRITGMYEFSRALGSALDIDGAIRTALRFILEFLNAKAAILLSDDRHELPDVPHAASTLELSGKDRGVADWSFRNRKPAGLFTATLPQSDAMYVPLIASGKPVGVLALRPASGMVLSAEQENLLQNIVAQLSMRIERENLVRINQQSLLVAESERLYKVLLNSLSHELRTPITTITGASSGLLDATIDANPPTRRALAMEISKASERLTRLIDNLLDMSRLESGMLRLNCQRHDAADLISVVIRRLANESANHAIAVRVDERLPLVWMDFSLMEQALINIVYNALLHTPDGTHIEISASRMPDTIAIAVRDNGPGLDTAELQHLFQKFRRGARAKTGGVGLGLSIAKGIIDAHGGTIRAENRDPGSEFIITLPLNDEKMAVTKQHE